MAKRGDFSEFRNVIRHTSGFNLKDSVVLSLRYVNRGGQWEIRINCIREIANGLV